MNIVNDDVIAKLLTAHQPNAQITIVRWHITDDIIKAGNNYMSEVSRLTVRYRSDGMEREKHFFLKIPYNSPMYQTGNKYDLFRKELIMYTEVLPQIYTFEDEYFTARNYYVDEKHSLFMKDLSQSGYKVADRTRQLDYEHCVYALKCLAKFHALSVNLQKTRGIPDIIRTDRFYSRDNRDDNLKNTFLSGLQKFYETLPSSVQLEYADQIEFFKTINWNDIASAVDPDTSKFNVLNHGDFWTNNVMFKYDRYGLIKKVKLLDFQIARWANPAVDLIYFTITSMRYEVYEKHYDLLLSTYLNTLNKILDTYNCETYKMDDLKNDIDARYAFAVVVLTCILPVVVSDPDNPIDMSKAMDEEKFNVEEIHKCYHQENYHAIAIKWFEHLARRAGTV